jgi:hypothetical protein
VADDAYRFGDTPRLDRTDRADGAAHLDWQQTTHRPVRISIHIQVGTRSWENSGACSDQLPGELIVDGGTLARFAAQPIPQHNWRYLDPEEHQPAEQQTHPRCQSAESQRTRRPPLRPAGIDPAYAAFQASLAPISSTCVQPSKSKMRPATGDRRPATGDRAPGTHAPFRPTSSLAGVGVGVGVRVGVESRRR